MHIFGGPPWVDMLVSIVLAVFASSGFWTWFMNRTEKKSAQNQLLLGLAHDRIIHIGRTYIDRGWISFDEYEDFMKYLWKPYSTYGGNGLAERISDEVQNLPMKTRKEMLNVSIRNT